MFAQDYFEPKYSINEIKAQQSNFKNNKIKKIIVTDDEEYFSREYSVNNEGQITKVVHSYLRGVDKKPSIQNYSYNGSNLASIIDKNSSDNSYYFSYDSKGNIIKQNSSLSEINYYYDSENRLLKTEVIKSEYESCSIKNIIYEGNKIIEIISECCEGNISSITRFQYDNGRLNSIERFGMNCSSGVENIYDKELYVYESDKTLPMKIVKEQEGYSSYLLINYEYYQN